MRIKIIAATILALMLIVIFALAYNSAKMDSATDDEPAHIANGYVLLKYGDFGFFREQPPLINTLSAVPLILSHYNFPANYHGSHWGIGGDYLFHDGNNADAILIRARLVIIFLFLILCLAVYVFILRLTKNYLAAFMALILTGLCPNLLASGRLVTVDLGLALFTFLAIAFFLRSLFDLRMRNILLAGLFTACALLSKISGIIILPYYAIIFLLFIYYKKPKKAEIINLIKMALWIIILAAVFIEIFYILEFKDMYLLNTYHSTSVMTKIKVPFIEYKKSFESIWQWATQPYGQPQFLLGKFSLSGWWYYYIVAFFLKTPLPTLILFFISFLTFLVFIIKKKLSGLSQKEFIALSLLIFIFLFFAVSARSNLDIGIRYILPIYPALYAFIAICCSFFTQSKRQNKLMIIMVVGLIIAFISSNIITYPSYLAYFNFLVKNEKADQYLIDSNLDWGQDLKRLDSWCEKNNIDQVYLDYFGGSDPKYYLGDKYISAQSYDLNKKGYYAISRHNFRASTYYPNRPNWVEAIENAKLITIIGNSIYVFKY